MYANVVSITPTVAEQMLQHNTNNYRKAQPTKVHLYARKMALGYWQENGEAIQFDKQGNLLNGQHRLMAIIESQTTQRMLVVYDVEADVFDSGKNRTLYEYSKIEGSIGGAISIILSQFSSAKRSATGNEEKTEYYNRHKDVLDKAHSFSRRGSDHGILKKAGCIAAIYCALRLDIMPEVDIETFCRITNSGFPEDGVRSEAPLALKKTLDRHKITSGGNSIHFLFDVTWQALVAFKKKRQSRNTFKQNGDADIALDLLVDLDKEEIA